MSNEKDQTTCSLIIVVLGLGKQLVASICHDRLALSKENILVLGDMWWGGMGGRGGRGGKRLEGLFGVLDIALIIQVRSFLANPYRYVGDRPGWTVNVGSESESIL